MAKISIDVDTNFAEASAEMKKFGGVLSTESEKYKNLIKKYDSTAINGLIEKNRRLAASISATNGPQKAAIAQQRALSKEIKKLVSEGLDPNGDELRELREEYQRVTVSVNDHIKANNRLKDAQKKSAEDARKAVKVQRERAEAQKKNAEMAKKAYFAISAAVVASTAAIAKNTFTVAANGDEYAKQGAILGVTAEDYQELAFAADRSGIEMNSLSKSISGMNKRIGEARIGTGSLVSALKDSNPQLLEQLKNSKNTSDAFDILTKAMSETTNVQDRAALASAAFGRSGMDLVNMTKEGVKGISELREEARKYGLISNEAARQSEIFVDSQTNLKSAFTGIKNSIGTELIPMFTNTSDMMTEFIQSFDEQQIDQFGESVKFVFKGILTAGASFGAGLNVIFTAVDARISQSVTASFALIELVTKLAVKSGELNKKVWDKLGKRNVALEKQLEDVRSLSVLMENARKASSESTGETIDAGLKRNQILSDYIFNLDKAFQKEQSLGAIGGEEASGGGGSPVGGGETPEEMREKMRLLTEEELLGYDARAEALLNFYDDQILSREEFDAKMEKARAKDLEKEKEDARARLSITSDIAGGLSNLFGAISDTRAKESKSRRALLVVEKALALSEIGINTGVGISKALASAAPPVNFINAGLVGANGIAAGIKVANTPIPSAETGADFIVPDTRTSRVDNVAVNAQPGERVTVEPRGEESSRMMSIVLEVDGRVLARSTQNYIDNGQIRITTDNVRRAG